MTAAPSSALVRAVFGVLVVATAAAFVITQRLKHGPSPVKRVFYAQWISPNGDGRSDSVPMRFDLPRRARAIVAVVGQDGRTVRRLVDGRRLGRGTHRFRWDGRTDAGAVVPDGPYRLRVSLLGEGRSLIASRTVTVDTAPPRPRLVEVTPRVAAPGARAPLDRARVRFEAPVNPPPRITVYRTGHGRPRVVAQLRARRGRRSLLWPLIGVSGRPVPDGSYAFALTAQDAAGNRGSAPADLPPEADTAPRGTGLTVRRLGLSGPLEPVRAGAVARLHTGPLGPRLSWTLRRGGSRRVLARGRAGGKAFAVRLPRRLRTGLHVLGVRAAGARAAWPLAVRGRPVGGRRPRAVVVLPVLTWLGENRADGDGDGFADSLTTTRLAALREPFASGSLPPGLHEALPVLALLDRDRSSYELTTDVALARGAGGLGGRRGLLLPGALRWVPASLADRMRRFAEGGGRVAAFGADALRRGVQARGPVLVAPTAPRGENAFGERVATYAGPPLALTAFEDEQGLLSGTGGALRPFAPLDESLGLPEEATRLASAGRDPERPALVAYRLGDGVVVRAGAGGFGAAADEPGVAATVRRAWTLISR